LKSSWRRIRRKIRARVVIKAPVANQAIDTTTRTTEVRDIATMKTARGTEESIMTTKMRIDIDQSDEDTPRPTNGSIADTSIGGSEMKMRMLRRSKLLRKSNLRS
jgi:hypothetical protein